MFTCQIAIAEHGIHLSTEATACSKKDAKAMASAKLVALLGEESASLRAAIYKTVSNRNTPQDSHSAKLIDVDLFSTEILKKLQGKNHSRKDDPLGSTDNLAQQAAATPTHSQQHDQKKKESPEKKPEGPQLRPDNEKPNLQPKESISGKDTKTSTENELSFSSSLSNPTSEAFPDINSFFMNVLAFATEMQRPMSEEVSQKNGLHMVSINFGDISCSATASGTANVVFFE